MLPGSRDLDRSQSADKNAFYPLCFPLYCKDCDTSSNSVLKLLSQESLFRVRGKGRKSSSYCICVLSGYCTQYPALTCAFFFFLFFSLSDFLFCTYIVLYILYMMTSVGSERTRGTRDKMQISTTQPTQPQKQVVQVRDTI